MLVPLPKNIKLKDYHKLTQEQKFEVDLWVAYCKPKKSIKLRKKQHQLKEFFKEPLAFFANVTEKVKTNNNETIPEILQQCYKIKNPMYLNLYISIQLYVGALDELSKVYKAISNQFDAPKKAKESWRDNYGFYNWVFQLSKGNILKENKIEQMPLGECIRNLVYKQKQNNEQNKLRTNSKSYL